MSNGMVIQGRLLSSDDIDIVREIIVSNPSWRRTRISQELCSRWGWFNHLGQPKDMACRSMLLKLEAKGYITLPARAAFIYGNREGQGFFIPVLSSAFPLSLSWL
jgi:hypothetical protein